MELFRHSSMVIARFYTLAVSVVIPAWSHLQIPAPSVTNTRFVKSIPTHQASIELGFGQIYQFITRLS